MQQNPDEKMLRWFSEFTRREYPAAWAVAARLLRGGGCPIRDADDIVQDAFTVAFRKLGTVYKHPKPRAWLYETVHKLFNNYLRRRIKTAMELPLESCEAIGRASTEEEVVARDWVNAAINMLSPEDYALYRYAYVLGYSPERIASILNLRVDTAMRRISRLREKLRKNLKTLSENDKIRHNTSERSSKL